MRCLACLRFIVALVIDLCFDLANVESMVLEHCSKASRLNILSNVYVFILIIFLQTKSLLPFSYVIVNCC